MLGSTATPLARLGLVWLAAAWGSLPVATAHADSVIGPGQESHVMALFAPTRLGDEVVPGCRLAGVSIRAREVELSLEFTVPSEPSATARVSLRAREAPPEPGMVVIAESESFALVASQADAVARRTSLLQLAERVRANDHGHFWTEVAIPEPELAVPDEVVGFEVLAGYAATAAVIAALLVVLRNRLRRLRRR